MLMAAHAFVEMAYEGMEAGYEAKDDRRIRDAAEKAWVSALHAVDHAMERHDLIPEPGAMAHASRHRFLERAGRKDLSDQLSVFADYLHGRVFYFGDIPPRERMGVGLEEVEQFIRSLSEEV